MRTHLLAVGTLFAAALLAAAPARGQVTKEDVPGITNFARLQTTVACAGATKVEAVPEIKKLGFASIINLREASATSVGRVIAWPPRSRTSSAVAARASAPRARSPTAAPLSANARAAARPTPELAPVSATTSCAPSADDDRWRPTIWPSSALT